MATPFSNPVRKNLFAFQNGFEYGRRLPDLPGAAGDFDQALDHRALRAALQWDLDRFKHHPVDDRRVLFGRLGALPLLEGGQFRAGVGPHLVLEPVADFRRMELPNSADFPPRDAAPVGELFDVAAIPAHAGCKLFNRDRLVRHAVPRNRAT